MFGWNTKLNHKKFKFYLPGRGTNILIQVYNYQLSVNQWSKHFVTLHQWSTASPVDTVFRNYISGCKSKLRNCSLVEEVCASSNYISFCCDSPRALVLCIVCVLCLLQVLSWVELRCKWWASNLLRPARGPHQRREMHTELSSNKLRFIKVNINNNFNEVWRLSQWCIKCMRCVLSG